MKFMRPGAADRAGIRRNRAKSEAQPAEDARIRVIHVAILAFEVLVIHMEGVGVLHHELARAHDPEARPDLVAKLGLDLIKIQRQLTIGADFLARDIGDHLLVRRAETKVALVAVLYL